MSYYKSNKGLSNISVNDLPIETVNDSTIKTVKDSNRKTAKDSTIKTAKDLVVFGEDWGALPSSTQQLIKHLARNRKIIWVNSIGLRQPTFCWHDIKRMWHKVKAVLCSAQERTDNQSTHHADPQFMVINPTAIPAPRAAITRYVSAKILAYQVTHAIKQAQLNAPILWISLPTAVDIVGKLSESAVVYYCCDDFNALAGVDHDTVNQREQQLADCADLILTASEVLRAKFSHKVKFDQKTVVTVEHGVDFNLFSQPTLRATDLPQNDKPTAGFYGSIAGWIDLELLQQTISQLPDWNFVFVGAITVDVSVLCQYKNVYFISSKPHNQLASYSQHWTVSLLPFQINSQILACNPFKLREYLAAGRPIVSTPFPALIPYQQLIDVVTNSQQMVAALQRARDVQGFDPLKRQAVINQTWEIRAAQVANLVDDL